MDLNNGKTPKVLFGPACNPVFVASFCAAMSELLGELFTETQYTLTQFADGEAKVRIEESVRGETVFVVQPAQPPLENFWIMKLLCNAAANANASRLVAIPTYMLSLRQDRKDEPRVPLTARLAVKELEASMRPAPSKHIVFITPHFSQVVNILDEATSDIIYPTKQMIDAMQLLGILNEDMVSAATDVGGVKIADIYRTALNLRSYAIGLKERDAADHVFYTGIIGDVRDKDVLVGEDIFDSFGTMRAFSQECHAHGAKNIYACAPHGIFAGKAFERLLDARQFNLRKVLVTNTVDVFRNLHKRTSCGEQEIRNLVHVVDIGPFLARVVHNTHTGQSISKIDGVFSYR